MIYNIWLSKITGIGCHLQRKLLDYFGTAKNVYYASDLELMNVKGIGKEKSLIILKEKSLAQAEKILRDCEKYGIGIMDINNEYYPEKAKMLSDMPTILYYKGKPVVKKRNIGIVGSRRCTKQGKQKTIELVEKLITEDTAIISGMAKGIDSYAHTICINNGGYTIAVLGNGLDICYPSEHRRLYEKIILNGLLISEYEPGVPASRYHFPLRNRIIAAFSDEIFVPEKLSKSGVDHTIAYAEKYGRKITIL